MLSYSSTWRSASAPRGLQHNISKARRRDDAGADIGIVIRQHRASVSTAGKTFLPRNCDAPKLTMQNLRAAKVGQLRSI